jgi:uncharacterized membrane protein
MWYHPFFLWFPIFPILFVVLFFFVFGPWGWGRRRWHRYYRDFSAEEILRERFARGGEEEYRKNLDVLRQK